MNIELQHQPAAQASSSAVVVFSFEGNPATSGTAELLPADTQSLLGELHSSGELSGKLFECTLVHSPKGILAQRLLVVGAGKSEKHSRGQLRKLIGTAVRYLRNRGLHDLAWLVGGKEADGDSIQALAEGAILADYDADRYRTEREAEKRIDRVTLVAPGGGLSEAALAALERGRVAAEATNVARDLVNEPSNRMTPTVLADRAQEIAARFSLGCEVLDADAIRNLKMGAFWAVAQGSDEPPKLIVIRYAPLSAPESPVIGLIGKGITFDTGGISIKPSENMHEMKTDMAGGATVLGAMQAIAQLKPGVRVIGIIPATENMPSGRAYKPGDVVTSMSGKTIEVLNTDAEGRLVLADALCYARQIGCTHLVDAATLTGAVAIALGNITTGVFGWNQEWVDRVLASAKACGERMWQLPIDEEYRELYKSSIADMANTGGRYGGAITGAMFIGEFAGETPWVHLDIAGTRWSSDEKPYQAKGPTGHGVRTLVHLISSFSN